MRKSNYQYGFLKRKPRAGPITFLFWQLLPCLLQKSPNEKWRLIIHITQEIGMLLTEDAWAWIDKEKKKESDILDFLHILTAIKNDEQKFWSMRLAIFENRKLAQEILSLMADRKAMKEASRLVKESQESSVKDAGPSW